MECYTDNLNLANFPYRDQTLRLQATNVLRNIVIHFYACCTIVQEPHFTEWKVADQFCQTIRITLEYTPKSSYNRRGRSLQYLAKFGMVVCSRLRSNYFRNGKYIMRFLAFIQPDRSLLLPIHLWNPLGRLAVWQIAENTLGVFGLKLVPCEAKLIWLFRSDFKDSLSKSNFSARVLGAGGVKIPY